MPLTPPLVQPTVVHAGVLCMCAVSPGLEALLCVEILEFEFLSLSLISHCSV